VDDREENGGIKLQNDFERLIYEEKKAKDEYVDAMKKLNDLKLDPENSME
jgi:hypothetical protein